MKLIICEKPSVVMAIASALGIETKKDGYMESEDFLVSWCIGHLAELSQPSCYGSEYEKWSLETLPILPETWQLTISKDKEKQFNILKKLLFRNDVTEVINACDAGREGELIFRFVMEKADCKKPVKRLWISSMEEGAIRKGFENLKDGKDYDSLYRSALCRAKADWLVGINATRLFSLLYNHTLNVGRVQSPTLKMLVDRNEAITNFKKEKYYHVRLALGDAEAVSEKFSDKEEAEKVAKACKGKSTVCTSLTSEKKEALPPKLFDLTALQKEANRIFGYTAKQTLDLAQSLYEKKLLTYPRTDSNYLTDDMEETAETVIHTLLSKFSFMQGVKLIPEVTGLLNSKKVSDYYAVIPTMELEKTELSLLPESEQNILFLAGARLLMACATSHIYETVTSPLLTAEWENELSRIAKEKADADSFMEKIEALTKDLIENADAEKAKAELFKQEKTVIGLCPRCKSPVYEGKKNYYCSNRDCLFSMWKNDRFFEDRKITFTPKIAVALLKDKTVKVKNIYSHKTGKTYDGNVVLCDTGDKYVNYRIEIDRKKKEE